jgi:hypothetical protein
VGILANNPIPIRPLRFFLLELADGFKKIRICGWFSMEIISSSFDMMAFS